jgi:hypothetical protein
VERVTPEEAVRGTAGPIGKVGGAFMFDQEVFARGAELGLDLWAWYHLGRGGVLGDPHPSVVVAAFGFFPPALQTKAWNKGIAVMTAAEATKHYADACVEFGRRRFTEADGTPRLAELVEKVVTAAEPAGLPLFAGWRQHLYDGPTDGPGRLALALMAARELRGGSHLLAVRAAGIPPLNAIMSGRNGATAAEFFGWPQPWPDPAEYKEQMLGVEATTDAMLLPAYQALSEDERGELTLGLRSL